MTDTMFTRTALTEAAKKAGVTTDQARTILEAAGVKVQPEKPEKPGPGTWHFTEGYMAPAPEVPAYVSKAGDLYLVHSDGRVEGFAGGSDAWPDLTPARIIPAAAPVTVTEDQVGEVWDQECGRASTSLNWATLTDRWKSHVAATVNALLAQQAAPTFGEPINLAAVQDGDLVRLVLDNGDEVTFTVRNVTIRYIYSRENAYLLDSIRAIHLLHRGEA